MVRISDLVRGKKETPNSLGDKHSLRLKNVAEMLHFQESAKADVRDSSRSEGHPGAARPSALATPEPLPQTQEQEQSLPMFTTPEESQNPPEGSLDRDQKSQTHVDGIFASEVIPSAKEIYFDAQKYLLGVRESLPRLGKLADFEKSLRIVQRIMAAPTLIEALYPLTMVFGDNGDLNTYSSVNCMSYCLKIGTRMGYDSTKLTTVALAALHHDIGMFLIPEAILMKTTKLTVDELAEVKKHARTGRDMLCPYEADHPEISQAVYQHHERESGQGYPEGLKGADICEYAKMIGICDSYEAMTHVRPHKRPTEQHVSVLELMETKALYFSPRILKVFLDEITLYPIGSYVRLNNRSIGVVASTNPTNPFKPVVRILVDGQGQKVPEERLFDLAGDNILNIVSGASADDVPA